MLRKNGLTIVVTSSQLFLFAARITDYGLGFVISYYLILNF